MRKAQIAALTAATLLVASGYYGLADALDLVPGPVTAAAEDITPQPFPRVASPQATVSQPSPLPEDAPVPQEAALDSLVQALEEDEALEEASVSASVIDVATGEEVLDHRAGTALTPASSNKLLTAWAALSLLGPEHTWETSTVLEGQTLTLVGGGDVLLAADEGDPTATAGRAGLGDLARQAAEALRGQGVTSVSLHLDDTLFSGPAWNEAWEAGNEAWVSGVQPIMVDVSAYHGQGGYPSDPALHAAQTFADHLREAGVSVQGSITRAAAADSATAVASVSSAPLADILALSLRTSDNSMTEVEGHLVAAAAGESADFEGAARAVLAQLGQDGFDTAGVTLLDSSGLAKGNKVPARLLAQVVDRAAGDQGGEVGRTLLAALPVGALDGTLDDRFLDTAAAGTVRAKTGSLDQTVSLSGVVTTADGRLLAFAVVVDGFAEGGLTAARSALDERLMVPLAACGCQG
ncbi:D-alanyl-D-alanine carboxypeptidase/D-alanyl-D-alanine endopeptidase [Actinomyces wuliandei]|uniref:D-alanyl-D-alanine carboxypeptidase/D-alanyl-D-alanine endopeptidase n=3 Tax=Actinomyces wuliandei TaxID=2057743 RepID=UPI000FD943D0|nr:D-alanyl-D-alanine carboxypeptidase/D-alanyl-D-alanine-endopeptidase [Actinomyces wuliandei]